MSEPKKIELIYTGQRQLNDKDIAHAFKLSDDDERLWTKAKYCIIGHRYEATIGEPKTDGSGDTILLNPIPKDLGKADIDDETLDEWRLKDKLAEQFAQRKRAHAAQKKRAPEIAKHTRELQAMYDKLRTNEDRQCFEALVLRCVRGFYNKN